MTTAKEEQAELFMASTGEVPRQWSFEWISLYRQWANIVEQRKEIKKIQQQNEYRM